MHIMSRHSNYLCARFVATVVVIVAASLAAVSPAFAVTNSPQTPRESSFCTNISAIVSKVNTSLTNLKNKMTDARNKQDQELATDRTNWDQEIQTNRSKADQLRQENFTELEAKAKTSTQLTAVKTYESAIMAALTARRMADDAARTTYRSGVDGVIAARRSAIDQQVTVYINAVDTAETTAQADCQATPDKGPSIRLTFQAALKSAREAYANDRKGDETIGSQVKQLAQTRDATFKADEATFLSSAQAARTTLKTVFGSAGSSTL